MTEHRIPTVLGRLRVEVTGEGPAVVLWPSLLMDAQLWAPQVADLSADHTTIALDPPGHGGSDRLRGPFTFEACALALEQVLDALGVEAAHVVGNSWGAMLAVHFAATRPDRTLGAVSLNGTAGVASRRQRLEYGALFHLSRFGALFGPIARHEAVAAFLGPTSLRERPDAVAAVTAAVDRAHLPTARWAIRSVVPDRPDQHALISRITAPVLVVAGAEDPVFPVEDSRRMADAIPGARLVVLQDAAHLVALEVPERVNALLREHLSGPGADAPGRGAQPAGR